MVESEIVAGHFTHDPDLDVETITAAEWGIQHQTTRLRLSSNIYYQRADDLITFNPLSPAEMTANWNAWLSDLLSGAIDDSVTPGPIFEYANDDNPLHTAGLELEADWQATHNWSCWGRATLQYASYERNRRLSSLLVHQCAGTGARRLVW